MTVLDQLPPMQFALDRVYAMRQACIPVYEAKNLPKTSEIDFGWNWRILAPAVFEVAISVTIKPSEERPDDIAASVAGVFRYGSGQGSGLSLQSFLRENAPAILMPYAREIISSLTARSYHGTFYLPPINVLRAIERITAQGGIGDQQIAADPALAEVFGIPPAKNESAPKTLPARNSS